jgi:hypothetical protein
MAGPEAAISLNVAMFRETRGALDSFPSTTRNSSLSQPPPLPLDRPANDPEDRHTSCDLLIVAEPIARRAA